MAHKHLTYLDIPAVRRRATAAKSLERLKDSLGNPALTSEQMEAVRDKIAHLNQWAAGTIPQNQPVATDQNS